MFAEGKAVPAEDSESDADSCAKSGSPDNYKELNSQTQRVLRGDHASAASSTKQTATNVYCLHNVQMVLSATQ